MEYIADLGRRATDVQQVGRVVSGVLLSVGLIQLATLEATTLPVVGEVSSVWAGALGLAVAATGFLLLQVLDRRGAAGCGCSASADCGCATGSGRGGSTTADCGCSTTADDRDSITLECGCSKDSDCGCS